MSCSCNVRAFCLTTATLTFTPIVFHPGCISCILRLGLRTIACNSSTSSVILPTYRRITSQAKKNGYFCFFSSCTSTVSFMTWSDNVTNASSFTLSLFEFFYLFFFFRLYDELYELCRCIRHPYLTGNTYGVGHTHIYLERLNYHTAVHYLFIIDLAVWKILIHISQVKIPVLVFLLPGWYDTKVLSLWTGVVA